MLMLTCPVIRLPKLTNQHHHLSSRSGCSFVYNNLLSASLSFLLCILALRLSVSLLLPVTCVFHSLSIIGALSISLSFLISPYFSRCLSVSFSTSWSACSRYYLLHYSFNYIKFVSKEEKFE